MNGMNSERLAALRGWAPHALLAAILAWLLRNAAVLHWDQYVVIFVAAVGLGHRLIRQWAHEDPVARAAKYLLGLGFLFAVYQLTPQQQGHPSVPAIVMSAFVFGLAAWGGLGRPRWADKGVVLLAVIVSGLAVYRSLLQGEGAPWAVLLHAATAVMLWFAVTRVVGRSSASVRVVGAMLVGALGAVSAVGVVQVGAVVYHQQRAEEALAAGETGTAREHFGHGWVKARQLELDGVAQALRFGVASTFARGGDNGKAAETLGMEEAFRQLIKANAWEGPEGGNLFREVSCWKDIVWYPGVAVLRIYASGDPAYNEWPLMEVMLGREVLERVRVDSRETKAYEFRLDISECSRKRLEIAFLNDVFQQQPHADRNLRVMRAEIEYESIYWLGAGPVASE